MSHLFRKCVFFLVFLIAVLQIIHMSLMSRLESGSLNLKNNHIKQRKHKYDNKTNDSSSSFSSYGLEDIIQERESMYRSLKSLSSVLDSSGEYRIVSFLSTADSIKKFGWNKYSILSKVDTLDGSNLYKKNELSIATHSTINELYHLDLLSNRWNGPISVSIFALSFQQLPIVVEVILLLRLCNPMIRLNTSFHLVYPMNFFTKLNNEQVRNILDFLQWPDIKKKYPKFESLFNNNNNNNNCKHIKKTIDEMMNQETTKFLNVQNYNHHVPYPNNLLRNIARRYSLTEYTFVIDIDLIPSENLYENFLNFAEHTKLFKQNDFYIQINNIGGGNVNNDNNNEEEKIVFVIPTFEISMDYIVQQQNNLNMAIPRNKKELINGLEQKFIRPFYIELCWKCQKYTDYESWLHSSTLVNNSSPNSIYILYEVSWNDPWEPFYISKNNVPLYDERFKQYGFNRISQTCELNMAGYRFAILNNAFLIHKGFKMQGNFHPNKDQELEHNRMLFRKFKLQLKERYPLSLKKC